ncbi:MAG: CBS domain-containing protein [Candidatus Methanoperedens sp.]|jgi:CBS domain-containing protein|nr:CBS domain-containing protein [Candidatus Methanoperedens sp.]PKL52821.1 MAG: CBS domain-containing protein [Candidatus Methanoperedenaceae archaeon HGW-Methanoperedenaceae-1]
MNKSSIKNAVIPKKEKHVRDGYTRNMGPLDFKSRISEHTGDIMTISSNEVVTIPPTMSIIGAVKTMLEHGFRRLPVADAGTNRLEGIVTSKDIVDFLGGGKKHLMVKNRYKGNFLAAVNANVSEIMEENVVSLNVKDSIKNAMDTMIKQNVGGIPVTDDENKVKAIVSEKDFVFLLAGIMTGKTVNEYMSKNIITAPPDMPIGTAARSMINNGIRRLPVVKGDVLVGIITASDIMRFLGSGDIFEKLVTGNTAEIFKVPISTLIKREVVFTVPETDLGETASIMLDKNVGSLPVFENSQLKGIITERDIVRAMAE